MPNACEYAQQSRLTCFEVRRRPRFSIQHFLSDRIRISTVARLEIVTLFALKVPVGGADIGAAGQEDQIRETVNPVFPLGPIGKQGSPLAPGFDRLGEYMLDRGWVLIGSAACGQSLIQSLQNRLADSGFSIERVVQSLVKLGTFRLCETRPSCRRGPPGTRGDLVHHIGESQDALINTDLRKFLDTSVSSISGHIAGASYRAGEAGAQATAQSERTKPVLVANRFHAISQASMMSAKLRNTELASQWLRR
jgi:hypothetical protein